MPTNAWEAENLRGLLTCLVGHDFGDEPEKNIPQIRQQREKVADHLFRQLQLNSRAHVLDLGSGCGFIALPLSRQVARVVCCDVSQAFLDYAHMECRESQNIDFHKINSQSLAPIADQSLDAAFSYNVFIHFNLFQVHLYLLELARVLKPNGRLVFDIANADLLEKEVPAYFKRFAKYYADDSTSLPSLICWNSPAAVRGLAHDAGFDILEEHQSEFVLAKR